MVFNRQLLDATTEAIRAFCAPPDCEHGYTTPTGEFSQDGTYERVYCHDCAMSLWVPES